MKKVVISLMALLCLSAVASAQSDLSLYPIGKNFGHNGSFQFGLDKSPTAGVCFEYDIPDRMFLTGPCRDIFVLAHYGRPAVHLGGSVGYGLLDVSKSHPVWGVRLGFNIGPAAKAALDRLADNVPALDAVGSFSAPKWAQYVGDITTLDFSGGVRQNPEAGRVRYPYGAQAKVNIPIDDLVALIVSAGGK